MAFHVSLLGFTFGRTKDDRISRAHGLAERLKPDRQDGTYTKG
jgi:hypothetical protein